MTFGEEHEVSPTCIGCTSGVRESSRHASAALTRRGIFRIALSDVKSLSPSSLLSTEASGCCASTGGSICPTHRSSVGSIERATGESQQEAARSRFSTLCALLTSSTGESSLSQRESRMDE